MIKWVLLGISGATWIFMLFLLYQSEIQPYLDYQILPSYKTLLKKIDVPKSRKAIIYLGNREVGEFSSIIDPKPDGFYEMRTNIIFKELLGLKGTTVIFFSIIVVDPQYNLHRFKSHLFYEGLGLRIEASGKRKGDKMLVEYRMPFSVGTDEYPLPKDAFLSDSFLPFHGSEFLAVGKKWRIETLDFDIFGKKFKTVPLWASVEEIVKYETAGKEIDAYVIEIRKDPKKDTPDYIIYTDKDGEPLEQIIELGKFLYRFVFVR